MIEADCSGVIGAGCSDVTRTDCSGSDARDSDVVNTGASTGT